jgi:molybdopterin-binding protein
MWSAVSCEYSFIFPGAIEIADSPSYSIGLFLFGLIPPGRTGATIPTLKQCFTRRASSAKLSIAMPEGKLFTPREAAQVLGISYPTLKQWIYKKKLRTVQTAGGHHRVPEKEVDKFLYRSTDKREVAEKRSGFRRISGRNQLIGRVTDIQIDGLIAQVTLSIGGQKITSIITADAIREMRLKKGDTAAALIKSTEVMILRP